MIDLLPTLLPTLASESAPTPVPVPGVRAASVDFGQTFVAFLDARDAATVPADLPAERQPLADDGKDLPDPPTQDDVAAPPPPVWANPLAPVAAPIVAPSRDAETTPPAQVERATKTAPAGVLQATLPAVSEGRTPLPLATPVLVRQTPIRPDIAPPHSVRFERSREIVPAAAQGFSTSLETNGADDAVPTPERRPVQTGAQTPVQATLQTAVQVSAEARPFPLPLLAPAPLRTTSEIETLPATTALPGSREDVAATRPTPAVRLRPDTGADSLVQIAVPLPPQPQPITARPTAPVIRPLQPGPVVQTATDTPPVSATPAPVAVNVVAAVSVAPALPSEAVAQTVTAPAEARPTDQVQAVRSTPDHPADVAAAPAIQAGTLPQPARQVFAAAIAAASRWLQERPARPDGEGATALPTLAPLHRPIVLATAATRDAPLDLGSERGLQQVIDRIETLRDAASEDADARSTTIRLAPDALGAVDIAVRKQGGQVHVAFSAEREATQALLVEAQPRLTELAAARGVRLAETSVSTGTPPQHGGSQHGGQGNTPQPRPTFARAPATAAAAEDLPIDHRLA